jgi:hypothetical protein
MNCTRGVAGTTPLQPALGQPHQPNVMSSSQQQKQQVESHLNINIISPYCSRTSSSSDLLYLYTSTFGRLF